jgi:hypothetical protein
LLSSVLALGGCSQIGPATVASARFDYNEAIIRSFDHQMLLNLVRLRYQDSVLFLDLTSVVASYRRDATVGATAGAEIPTNVTLGLNGNMSWGESPTITYAPLQGEEFAKRMLAPIHPASILLLSRTGWGIERTFMCTVQLMNELWNGSALGGLSPNQLRNMEKFHRAITLMRDLDEGGYVHFTWANDRADLAYVVPGPVPMDEEAKAKVRELRELLKLGKNRDGGKHEAPPAPPGTVPPPAAPGGNLEPAHATDAQKSESHEIDSAPWSITIGYDKGTPHGAGHITMAGRSMLGVMAFLAQRIDVPEEHVQQGLVRVARGADGSAFNWSRATGQIFHVRSGRQKPTNACLQVFYRGYWFWIEDNDLETKSTYTLLTQLFSLQAATGDMRAPILTIPTK